MGIVVEYAGATGKPVWTGAAAVQVGLRALRPRGLDAAARRRDHRDGHSRRTTRPLDGFNRGASTARRSRWRHGSRCSRSQRGARYRLRMRNATDDIHPIHLHRHSFELTTIAGQPTGGVMKDVGDARRLPGDRGRLHRRRRRACRSSTATCSCTWTSGSWRCSIAISMLFGHPLRGEWPLDPAITYLNHGTVGVAPYKVLRVQQALRDEMERQPSRFMLREVSHSVGARPTTPTRLRRAAEEVAAFVGARGADLVFVDNATAASTRCCGRFRSSRTTRSSSPITPTAPWPMRCDSSPRAAARRFVPSRCRIRRSTRVSSWRAWSAPSHPGRGCSSWTTSRRAARSCCRCVRWQRRAARGASRCSSTAPTRQALLRSTSPHWASTITSAISTSGRRRRGAAPSCGPRQTARLGCIHR